MIEFNNKHYTSIVPFEFPVQVSNADVTVTGSLIYSEITVENASVFPLSGGNSVAKQEPNALDGFCLTSRAVMVIHGVYLCNDKHMFTSPFNFSKY